jgi:hypothetical protein
MTMPGFTAENALYRSGRQYSAKSRLSRGAQSAIVPATWWGYCAVLAAGCLAALADAVPGDEVVACGYFYFQCQQIDA